MVMLSVDYGDVRTGIAVCDKRQILASPVTVIKETEPDKLAIAICELCREYHAEQIILGLPVNMDGSQGFRADAVKAFAEILEKVCGLPIKLRDERLTTVAAHRALSDAGVFGKKRKQTIDAVSAVMILQDYIDSLK